MQTITKTDVLVALEGVAGSEALHERVAHIFAQTHADGREALSVVHNALMGLSSGAVCEEIIASLYYNLDYTKKAPLPDYPFDRQGMRSILDVLYHLNYELSECQRRIKKAEAKAEISEETKQLLHVWRTQAILTWLKLDKLHQLYEQINTHVTAKEQNARTSQELEASLLLFSRAPESN